MTLKEAMEKGLTKIRLPVWNPHAYLELYKLPSGHYGPWVTLKDVGGFEQKILFTEIEDNDFEHVDKNSKGE